MKSVFLLKKAKKRISNLGAKRLALLALLLVISVVSLAGFLLTAPKQTGSVRTPLAQGQSGATAPNELQPASNQSQLEPSRAGDGSSPKTIKPNTSAAPAQTAGNTTKPQSSIDVNVNITGSSSFTLTLPFSSNHCDVLSYALSQGKIAQLDMRYNSGYGSYGVYKINNIGQANQIWWTFRVNGVSPAKGCSYVPVNNYDQIVWEYIGP